MEGILIHMMPMIGIFVIMALLAQTAFLIPIWMKLVIGTNPFGLLMKMWPKDRLAYLTNIFFAIFLIAGCTGALCAMVVMCEVVLLKI